MKNNYELEISMSPSDVEDGYCDIWGAASIWEDKIGAEYNLCVEDGDNCSAIYRMDLDESTGYWTTNYSDFEHYEVDFSDADWEKKLEIAMYKFLRSRKTVTYENV